MTVHYYRTKELGATAIERPGSYTCECLMSVISIVNYIFDVFCDKIELLKIGGTVFKCICRNDKFVKYYYNIIYMNTLQGIYMYILIYDICYSLNSVGLGETKTCNIPKF